MGALQNKFASNNNIIASVKEDFFPCRLCASDYVNPQILPCLHSFCEKCLQQYVKHTQTANKDPKRVDQFMCPVCQTWITVPEQGVSGFQQNPFLKSIQDISSCFDTVPKNCEICERMKFENLATSKCIECGNYLCETCAEHHFRTKFTDEHHIVSLEELRTGKYVNDMRSYQRITCGTHDKEELKFFCTECDRLLCRDCVVVQHKDHKMKELAEVYDQGKEVITDELRKLQGKIRIQEIYNARIQVLRDDLSASKDEITAKIKKRSEELVALVKEREIEMLKELHKVCKEENQMFDVLLDEGKQDLNRLKNTQSLADKIVKYGKEAELLAVQRIVVDRLSDMDKCSVMKCPGILQLDLKIDENLQNQMTNGEVFGSLKIKNAAQLVCEFSATVKGDVKSCHPTGLAVDNNDIMICDSRNKKVKIFTNTGDLQLQFDGKGGLLDPRDVAVTSEGQVAVTDFARGKVMIFTPGVENATDSISTGRCHGATFTSDDNLVVSIMDNHKEHVTIYKGLTSIIKQEIRGNERGEKYFTNPMYVAMKKGRLYVTDYWHHCLMIFNATGKLVAKYGNEASGELLGPRGVCVDQFDNVLIADAGNQSIHLVSPDGQFQRLVLTAEDGLHCPIALGLTMEGHLVVTEWGGQVRIFKYM